MAEVIDVRYCAHCGHKSPQKIQYYEDYVVDYADESTPLYFGKMFLACCQTCFKLLLYNWDETFDECSDDEDDAGNVRNYFCNAILVWPSMIKFDAKAVPRKILELYEEASKVKLLSPSSCVVQIRRALEAVCLDQEIHEPNLHKALKELTTQKKLPPLVSEIASVIKIIGNAGAHASNLEILQAHVSIVEDFFRVVLEYLYIAPYKLKKFKEEVNRFSKL